uniref:Uncharacterized protein n=1 Tax=Rhizophora mucronata TaxID=61149 RepID=A0A2P2P9H6_RHIMU
MVVFFSPNFLNFIKLLPMLHSLASKHMIYPFCLALFLL